MADLTIFLAHLADNVRGGFCAGMLLSGPVADLATGVFQMRGLFNA